MRLRQENFDTQKFVPEGDLQDLLSEDVIARSIRSCDIDFYKHAETIHTIKNGARKIFAILVLLNQEVAITKFIENDQLQCSQLDSKLPFPLSILESMEFDGAQDFYERQWEFVSPIFSDLATHRVLDNNIRLPIMESKYLGEGGFGRVFKIVIHRHHRHFRNQV